MSAAQLVRFLMVIVWVNSLVLPDYNSVTCATASAAKAFVIRLGDTKTSNEAQRTTWSTSYSRSNRVRDTSQSSDKQPVCSKSAGLGTLKNAKSTRFDKEGLNGRGECKVIKSHKKLFIDELCYISTGVQ